MSGELQLPLLPWQPPLDLSDLRAQSLPPQCPALLTTEVNCPRGSPLFHPGRCRTKKGGWGPGETPRGWGTFWWDCGAIEDPCGPGFPVAPSPCQSVAASLKEIWDFRAGRGLNRPLLLSGKS